MLYYTHINEDNTIERMLLERITMSRVIAVAGSGERVLALMDNPSVELVVAVDISREALFLLQLKIAALKVLTVKDYLSFIGHAPATPAERRDWFAEVSPCISDDCLRYWQNQVTCIQVGVLGAGHFERFLSRIRPFLLTFLGRDFQQIFSEGTNARDLSQSIRWKSLAWTFSKKWVYQVMGNNDQAFVGEGADVRIIPAVLTSMISSRRAQTSFLFHLIFKGHLREMSTSTLPPSLQESVLSRIKDRLMSQEVSVEFHEMDLLEYLKRHHCDKPAFYSLSDILSCEGHDYFAQVLENIPDKEGTVIVVRSFLRNRLSLVHLKQSVPEYKEITFMDELDRSGMYQVVVIEK